MNLEYTFYASLALTGGPFLFFRGLRRFQLKRVVEDTPTAQIRSMAMGLVELNGTVHPRSRQVAPFTGRDCAYWEVDVAVPRGRRGWGVVHRARSKHPFYLEDESGVALVYPDGAECKVHFPREEVCMGIDLPPVYSDYIRERGGIGLKVARLGALRFRERAIEDGQRVYLLGSAFPRTQSVDLSGEDALAATGTEDRTASRLRGWDSRVAGVIRRGENHPVFIISQESELSVRLGLAWTSWFYLAVGPILSLMGLWYWLSALQMGHLP